MLFTMDSNTLCYLDEVKLVYPPGIYRIWQCHRCGRIYPQWPDDSPPDRTCLCGEDFWILIWSAERKERNNALQHSK